MSNKWIALAFTVALTTSTLGAKAADTVYTDAQGNWAQSDINSVVGMDIMSGFNDSMFHPDAWVSRQEFSAMAAKSLGLSSKKSKQIQSLDRLSHNYWSIDKLDDQAAISAYPAGVYRPENPVRRVEALSAAAGTLNKPLVSSTEADTILSQYSDASQIPTAARQDVATAIKYNLFTADPNAGSNLINPLQPITRAETAHLLNGLYADRDISLVQDGKVVALVNDGTDTTSTSSTTGTDSSVTTTTPSVASTTTDSTTTASTSTYSADSAAGTTAMTPTTTTTYTTATGTSTTDPAINNQAVATGDETKLEKKANKLYDKAPYRHSADTLSETNTINQTSTPSDLEASQSANVPATGTFTATNAKALYSEFNRVGDPVMVIVDHAVIGNNGAIAIPAGSKLLGVLSKVKSNNTTNKDAELGINFKEFVTPAGQRVPLNATVANTDGILKAGELQGVVFHPNSSVAALKSEINTASGALYGTKIGKASVLEEPMATQVSAQPLDPMDKRPSDIVLGVGDVMQIRLGTQTTEAAQ